MPAKYKLRNTTAQDYYPFGMPMPGLHGPANSTYSFGFNGKENDNEIKGYGNQQDYGMRIYDTRIARFLSVDPITKDYPELTPFQFASNSPISGIDLDGLEYVNVVHYADGRIEKIMLYKMSAHEIEEMGGTTSGRYNSASYGSQGKGIQHIFYDASGKREY